MLEYEPPVGCRVYSFLSVKYVSLTTAGTEGTEDAQRDSNLCAPSVFSVPAVVSLTCFMLKNE
jgi:hypothetical protein